MKDRVIARLVALLAFLLPLAVYLRTLAREATFTDARELVASSSTLGIAHPPGYPLFTILGRVMTALPWGTPMARVALLSALSMALAAWLIHRCALRLSRRSGGGEIAASLAALSGALLFAFAATPWSQAVVVEVYALQALLHAAILALAIEALDDRSGPRRLPSLMLLLGLALTNHLASSLLLAPALLLVLIFSGLKTRGRDGGSQGIWGWSVAALIAPLTLYLYLPLRARQNPAVIWDYLESPERFFMHVSGRQYQRILGSRGWSWDEPRRFLTEQLPAEAGWALLVLAGLGLLWLAARHRAFLLASLLAVAAQLFYNAAYPIHDIGLYYIPALLVLGLWAGLGAAALVRALGARRRGVALICASLLPLVALVPLRAHWRVNDQSDFQLVASYTRDMLEHLEPDAVLFSSRWDAFCSPALYYQQVESLRPDVLILDLGSLAHPALGRKLALADSALHEACEESLALVREISRRSERGQDEDLDMDKARYDFDLLRRRLVEQALKRRPTYMTSELRMHGIFVGFQQIPWGLALRLDREEDFVPPPVQSFSGPDLGLEDCRDEREREIWDDYARMKRLRTHYLERHDQPTGDDF